MKWFLLLIFIACGTTQSPPDPAVVFIQELKTDYEIKDDVLLAEYQTYLLGVEAIFQKYHQEVKFPEYITSVKNSFQLHSHTDFLLQGRYRKERAGRPHFLDYKTYRKNILTELRAKLDQERLDKLAEFQSAEFVSDLKAHHFLFPNLHSEFPL